MGSDLEGNPMRFFYAAEEARTRLHRACNLLREAAVDLNNASDILKHQGACVESLREWAQGIRDFENRLLRQEDR